MRDSRLFQLLAENRKPFKPIESKVSQQGRSASIYLYDPIVSSRLLAEWFGAVCHQDFVQAVRGLDADSITIYTNCPGGDVFSAEAISQALREHPANVVMQIEGMAASAATSIACACDKVVATKGSKYMIHQTWKTTEGNADDHDAGASLLRKADDSMFDEYVRKTGVDRQQIVDWCKAETWFTADEAKAHGFIDEILEPGKRSANASAQTWNLSAYTNPPKPDAEPVQQGAPELEQPAPEPEPTITDDHRARQQQRLNMLSRI